jgi:hypothetical protein
MPQEIALRLDGLEHGPKLTSFWKLRLLQWGHGAKSEGLALVLRVHGIR